MSPTESNARAAFARPLLPVVLSLLVLHVGVLTFLPHPLLASNLVQLGVHVVAAYIAFAQCRFVPEIYGRRCWAAMGVAFSIWSLAQICYIALLYLPRYSHSALRPDDVLWVLFGLPMLMAVSTFTEESVDRVLWLDRLQTILFFAVVYLLIFLPSIHLNLTTAFMIQDTALLLCCLFRLPNANGPRQFRFFFRIVIFLLLYAPATTVADMLHEKGWRTGTLLDLAWTVPTTCFSVMVLWHAISPWRLDRMNRVVRTARSLQGFSIAALALLSVACSAYLAVHAPLPGSICIACTFGLFALRTNARELAWQYAHQQLKQTALRDALTGLGNRMLLKSALQDRLRAPDAPPPALIFADLDHFKHVNDSLGHSLGDQLLTQLADRLRAAAPTGSVLCRLGGDEFVVLTAASTPEDARVVAEKLLEAMRQPYRIGVHLLCCTASIGVVLACPGEEAEDLLRVADHAMYRAKQAGKNCVQLFDASLRAQMTDRWQMEADLRRTLDRREIDVAFQPIAHTSSRAICGFEALARWNHPLRGAVPPIDFIPLAEDSGLILQLGAQVIEKACAQVAAWNIQWGANLSLSVNVSPRQFADGALLPKVLEILERTGLPPSLLSLEITESALLGNEALVRQTLVQARESGIRISLDDFGTGYSSLAFLLSLPVDEVKVDRSFVHGMTCDPQRRELVRTVVQLGRSLGKRVIAEGVESEDELQALHAISCDCAQGWLISRPLAPAALETKLGSFYLSRGEASPIDQTAPNHPSPDASEATRWQGSIEEPEMLQPAR